VPRFHCPRQSLARGRSHPDSFGKALPEQGSPGKPQALESNARHCNCAAGGGPGKIAPAAWSAAVACSSDDEARSFFVVRDKLPSEVPFRSLNSSSLGQEVGQDSIALKDGVCAIRRHPKNGSILAVGGLHENAQALRLSAIHRNECAPLRAPDCWGALANRLERNPAIACGGCPH